MARHQRPDLEVQIISEELATVPEVRSTAITDEGVWIELEDGTFSLFYPTDSRQEQTSEEADRVLFVTDHGYMDFGDERILLHDYLDSMDSSTLLKKIVTGSTEPREVEMSGAFDVLTEQEYLPASTPKELGELMTGWVVSDKDETILDIATGSGSLLEQAADKTDKSDLVGIERHPTIAALARIRLNGVERAEIVTEDFFGWRVPGQQESASGADADEGSGKFDAVVGNPPMGRLFHVAPEERERIREWAPGRGKSAAGAFVAKAVSHLKEGGRGAFLLPKTALKDGLLEQLTESCGIHRIVDLPVSTLQDIRSGGMVLLTLVKEDRLRDVRDTGIAKFNQMELPENARGLFEQPLDEIVQNRYNPYNAELVRASHADLEGRNVMRILSNPSIYDIITADGFTKFGELSGVEAGSGVSTGKNDFFYFSEEEKTESGIADRFFRPVIKNPSDDIRTITRGDIDRYLLDLQPFTDKLASQGVEITEDRVIEALRQDGHSDLAAYIENEPGRYNPDGPKFEVDYRGKFENPDLVISKFFDTPRCYTVEVDDALFDSTMIGIQTDDDVRRDSLARVLNTPLYKEFFQTFADPIDLDWYQFNITSFRDIPVTQAALSQDFFDRMDPFFPPDDDNDLVSLNQLLIESCGSDEEKQALRRYLASRDDYAWSWFMTLPEFEEFQELVESDKAEAREFVVDRFEQELLEQARDTFENIGFFEERRELLNDLLMEFEEGHYRGFLAGIVLQFEGVLADLVEEAGGEIIEEDHETKFKMPGKGRSQTKNLGSLISHFFDGVFSTFLDETVRQRRNRIAHGDVIENSRDLSIHFFISFYALCNAALNEYVRLADQNGMRP